MIDELGKTDYFLLKGGRVDLEPLRHRSVQDYQKKSDKKPKAKPKLDEKDFITQYLERRYENGRNFAAKRSLLRQHKFRVMRIREDKDHASNLSTQKSHHEDFEPHELIVQKKEKEKLKTLLEAIRLIRTVSVEQQQRLSKQP